MDRFKKALERRATVAPPLRALKESADKNKKLYQSTAPEPGVLEWFPTPEGVDRETENLVIKITTSEFTSLCPKTGQPDFATMIVRYRPRERCVESKSYKIYLGGFRNHGEFHEACVQRILRDLVKLLDPLWMEVEGQFTPRGGIPFWPTATYEARDWNERAGEYR